MSVSSIQTTERSGLSDQENDFYHYPEKAAFNNLIVHLQRLEDPFIEKSFVRL